MNNPFPAVKRFVFLSFQIFVVQTIYSVSIPVAGPVSPSTSGTGGIPIAAFAFQPVDGSAAPETKSRLEILYGRNELVLTSEVRQKTGKSLQRAKGNVTITFLDMVLTCEEAEYDENTGRVSTGNPTRFRSRTVSLTSAGASFDPVAQTVRLKAASGYFYETSGKSDREFFLAGGMSQKIEAEKLEIYWGTGKRE